MISNIKEGDFRGEERDIHRTSSMDSLYQNELKEIRANLEDRESALMERESEISQLRKDIQERDESLLAYQDRIKEFEANNKLASPTKKKSHHDSNDMKKTVARLTARNRELEIQLAEKQVLIERHQNVPLEDEFENEIQELRVANKSLEAELDESKKKLLNQQQKFQELKKAYQKDIKMKGEDGNKSELNGTIDNHKLYNNMNKSLNENPQEINFTYLKHVILKYMCSTNDQSRQLIGVIAHLLQFSEREEHIVKECAEWKLPLKKK